jgi:thiosulfate/3-mercaptopyruvate sulfurtransferase
MLATIHAPSQSQDSITADKGKPTISDPWSGQSLIDPQTLNNALLSGQKNHLAIIYVGPPVLFKRGHIAGAIPVGQASESAGAMQLKKELRKIAKDMNIILYCGCCPWKNCPNIRPAYTITHEMGFRNVEVLDLPNDFKLDWAKKGFPVEK